MAKILKNMFECCEYFSDESYHLLKKKEIIKYDAEIKGLIKNFENSITNNKEIEERFSKFCEDLNDVYSCRDFEICRLLVIRGMALYMQMQSEILSLGSFD